MCNQPRCHVCMARANCNAKKMQCKKNCNAKKLQCKKNCNAKKTAMQKNCNIKIIEWFLVQIVFTFGSSTHRSLSQTHSPQSSTHPGSAHKSCKASKTATQKKCNAKKTAMQKKLQCKKNCNAKKKLQRCRNLKIGAQLSSNTTHHPTPTCIKPSRPFPRKPKNPAQRKKNCNAKKKLQRKKNSGAGRTSLACPSPQPLSHQLA